MTDDNDTSPPLEKGKPRSKFWLYAPFVIFALLCAAYSGYWFFAKGKIDEGINQFVEQQRAAGGEISFSKKHLGGFPFRFALTVDDLKFVPPNAGIDWRAEKFQANMLPWNFNHVILRSSGRNALSAPDGQDYTALIGRKSALSLNWDQDGIQEGGLALDAVDIVTAYGDFALDNVKISLVDAGVDSPGKRILIDWDGITIAEELIAGTDAAILGTTLQPSRLRLEGQGFGIFGEAEERKFEIAQLLLNWGPAKLGTKGTFRINDTGFPDGTLHIRLDDAEELGTILRDNGLLTSETALFFGPLSLASKDGGFFPVPIRNGAVSYPGVAAQAFPQLAPARPAE